MVAPIAFVTVPVYEKRGVNFHQPVLDYDDDNGVRLGGVTLVGEMLDLDFEGVRGRVRARDLFRGWVATFDHKAADAMPVEDEEVSGASP